MTRSLCLSLLILLSASAGAQAPATVVGIGVSAQGPPLSYTVQGLDVAPDGTVWARGLFGQGGPAPYSSIARWDGTGWRGTAVFQGSVSALALAPSGDVFAGGRFDAIDGRFDVTGVARWDGTAWQPMGTGIGVDDVSSADPVADIVAMADGSVVVGGTFTRAGSAAVANVARWTGSAWQAVGTGLGGQVRAIAGGADGALYAGGYPLSGPVAGEPLTGVMRYDGTAWTSFAAAFRQNNVPAVISQIVAAPDGRLIVRGWFDEIGGVPVQNLAEWTGTTWQPLGGDTFLMSDLALSASGELLGAGFGDRQQGQGSDSFLWRWTGDTWVQLSTPVRERAGTVLAAAPDGTIVAGGEFEVVGSGGGEYAARWTGTEWAPLGSRVNGTVVAAVAAPGGGVYVGGAFTSAPSAGARYVAEWTGNAWQALGDGLFQTPSQLTVGPDGSLYASGFFYDYETDTPYGPVVRWDGASWTGLTGGADANGFANAVVVWQGEVYRDGYNSSTGAYGVYRWTGAQWEAFGELSPGYTFALAVGPDGGLYVGGTFYDGGGNVPTSVLARWSGTAWVPVTDGLDGWDALRAFATGPDGAFYALGDTDAGTRIVRQVGSAWESVGEPLYLSLRSLAVAPDGRVYASGGFGASSAPAVVVWDGVSWEPALASVEGDQGSVEALAFTGSGDLVAGGSFQSLGGVVSPNVALYRPSGSVASGRAPERDVHAVTVAPNPARGAARLTATVPAGAAQVSVFDALGRLVAVAFDGETAGTLSVPLDLGGLAPGVYLARLTAGGAVQTARFTVAR